MGGLMDVDVLVEQVWFMLNEAGQNTFTRDEILGLIRKAAEKVSAGNMQHCFPIKPPPRSFTNAIAGESPGRGVRMPSGDRGMDKITGADRGDLSGA